MHYTHLSGDFPNQPVKLDLLGTELGAGWGIPWHYNFLIELSGNASGDFLLTKDNPEDVTEGQTSALYNINLHSGLTYTFNRLNNANGCCQIGIFYNWIVIDGGTIKKEHEFGTTGTDVYTIHGTGHGVGIILGYRF